MSVMKTSTLAGVSALGQRRGSTISNRPCRHVCGLVEGPRKIGLFGHEFSDGKDVDRIVYEAVEADVGHVLDDVTVRDQERAVYRLVIDLEHRVATQEPCAIVGELTARLENAQRDDRLQIADW